MPETIHVRLRDISHRSYPIVIGISLDSAARDIVRRQFGSPLFIVTDSHVEQLYGKQFVGRLRKHGAKAHLISIRPGERSKSRDTKSAIEDRILASGGGRASVVIGLGGGVVGDIAGFVAATFARGVAFLQIPTTLMAQVDSSVGGKVGINHPSGKNLIGAFHQPESVYIDPGVLSTLPKYEFGAGMAEVVKYGVILDASLLRFVRHHHDRILERDPAIMTRIIERCCRLKRMVVEKDEREASYRRILNFGHTIGHAIEQCMGYSISHGRAVSIGMSLEAKLAVAEGMLAPPALEELKALLESLGLPTQLPLKINLADLVEAAMFDKKNRNGQLNFTLPVKPGKAKIDRLLPAERVMKALRQ